MGSWAQLGSNDQLEPCFCRFCDSDALEYPDSEAEAWSKYNGQLTKDAMNHLHRASVWIAGLFRNLGDVLVGMDGVRGRWGHEKNPAPVQKTHKLKMTFDP